MEKASDEGVGDLDVGSAAFELVLQFVPEIYFVRSFVLAHCV